MKLLVISHAYAERNNHKKLEILSTLPELKVGVIYPKYWKTWHGEDKRVVGNQKLVIKNSYEEFPLDTFFTGDGGRYVYNPIRLVVSVLKFKPDLIYVEEEPFVPVSFEISILSLIFGKRFIFFTWENLDLPLGKLRSFIEKITFTTASKAVVGNLEATERLKKRGFLKPTATIPQFGVNLDVFYETDDEQREKPDTPLTIGFVGRPSMAKGIDVLMEAVSRLPFDYRLIIVTSSKGIPKEFLDLAYTLGISEKVQYKTSIPHTKLPLYFNHMDIFVLPSRTTKTWKEQFGRTLLEAMACGIPVVGSSSGAIPEVVGNAGLIFTEGDSEDLVKIIIRMSDPARRENFVEAGRKRVLENYTYLKICQDLHEFISH